MNPMYGGFGRPVGMRGELALMQYYFSRTALRGYAKETKAETQPPPPAAQPAIAPESAAGQEAALPAPPETAPEPETAEEAPEIAAEIERCDTEIARETAEDSPTPAKKARRFTPKKRGLVTYKKYWFRRESDFRVNGETITGTPIYLRGGTLRVVNPSHSYYIPVEKIDYIRTDDGYNSPFCRKND